MFFVSMKLFYFILEYFSRIFFDLDILKFEVLCFECFKDKNIMEYGYFFYILFKSIIRVVL